jgi:lysophosphatidic acid acyltransferase/lysophosphatidylinositol acyltransferase
MFCEGTRFTKQKHEASMKIAREKGLKELQHHLLPRTKGFSLLARGAAGRSRYI